MRKKWVLVTGGCGYIGSHAVLALQEKNYNVIILDNLSTGFRESVDETVPFIKGDVGDPIVLRQIFSQYQVHAIMHFAASVVVPDSITDPLSYYRNNTINTIVLLEEAVHASVKNLIFSSTAAVYGEDALSPISETSPTNPINPYGMSKLIDEFIIHDVGRAHKLNYVILRYFNVAGADINRKNGQRSPNASHLIKAACETALGKRESITIFGTDYPTADGTAIRDYVHVTDLANAHLLALEKCLSQDIQEVFNCGYGRGFSVREVLQTLSKIIDNKIAIKEGNRRPGDASQVVAENKKIIKNLGWRPQLDSLESIISSALTWEKHMQLIEKL